MSDPAFPIDGNYLLEDRYTRDEGRIFLTGTQAILRLALTQRRLDRQRGFDTAGFISGYRGSPLGGVDQELWRRKKLLEAERIRFEPGLNEDLAATAIWGTQQIGHYRPARYEGVFSFWYGKGNGVDRSGDVFRLANAHGTQRLGGVLAFAGDDHAAQSSIVPHQTDQIFEAVMMPVLNPASVAEYLELGLAGIAMSRFAGTWVAFKAATEIVESGSTVDLDTLVTSFDAVPDIAVPPHGFNSDPGLKWPAERLELERRLQDERLPAAQAFARANQLDRTVLKSGRRRLGIVTTGKAHADLMEALSLLGIDRPFAEHLGISIYKIALSWPVEPQSLADFARGHEEILVVEEKRSLVEMQVRAILYNDASGTRARVTGKTDEANGRLLSPNGELTPEDVARALVARLDRLGCAEASLLGERLKSRSAGRPSSASAAAPVARAPFFCSGCPHNSSTRLPEGSSGGGGTGCHIMVLGQGRHTETYSQMGGEGVQWVGEAPFSEVPHIFQNMGDGTYQHSGSLAIRQAVAAKTNITFKILFNDAVAMTGGQMPEGQLTVPKIVDQVLAEGVAAARIVTDDPERYASVRLPGGVSVRPRDDLDAVQRELRETEGTTVLVYDQTCAAEKRRRRKRGLMADPDRRLFINHRVCEGCGDCAEQSNCISIEPLDTLYGQKRRINQSTCNKDYSCAAGFCPSFVSVEGVRLRKPSGDALERLKAQMEALPVPSPRRLAGVCNILVAGIGGTGVVTVGALLSMAAHLEGKAATVLDFTGLAQKNGAVLSHLRIAATDDAIHAVRVPHDGTDVLIGCDIVVAAGSDVLRRFAPDRTRMAINTEETPTAANLKNPLKAFPAAALRKRLLDAAREADFIDATRLATGLFGDAIATNIFLLGYALQKGWLPVSLDALARAIELNGVAVAQNRQILDAGRLHAHDRAALTREAGLDAPSPENGIAGAELTDSLARELEAYQDRAYAGRFRSLIEKVERTERRIAPQSAALTEAVTRSYFRLLAVKDEYEVARLYTDGTFAKSLKETFDGRPRLRFHMAPPIFARPDPRTGTVGKIAFGGWIMPFLRLLARLKFLRGSWLDPFSYTGERRFERGLTREFEGLVDGLLESLTAANLATAVEIAALPQDIRGYGHVKRRSAETQARRRTDLLSKYFATGADEETEILPARRATT